MGTKRINVVIVAVVKAHVIGTMHVLHAWTINHINASRGDACVEHLMIRIVYDHWPQ